MRDVWVVGDRFAGFARLNGVTTVSGAGDVLDGEPVTLRLGQGVGPHERDHLRALVERRGLADRVVVVDTTPAPAGRDLVHKHLAANVLLGDVHAAGGGIVTAALRLAGENELLLDHQTGLHVQGMVVIEAVRQMLLAAYATASRRPDDYVVWNGIQLDFESFLFPLPARLYCALEPVTDGRGTARVQVEQGGRRVASALARFTAFAAERIAPVEQRRAEGALRAGMPESLTAGAST
ncbi:AfsA-related hotdog domain-containing protein [Phytohabitans houttuyneae]|uniref:A-factor biosynthesis protein AfsA n=1 Tax=Phytohabitans houttuyneae TaxID=1076126 RepID=A0A6V8K2A0_9ACTN|nr:AfsA-related hotdog domain-containing protein [Phytohabitans houttuyneae]GFJ76418.1 A-factor biosynthesis protein AfsA [Phytohabitans houttuyneae]